MSGNYHIICRGGHPAVAAEMECPVDMMPRFGGWLIGCSRECNIVIKSRTVEKRHVLLETTDNAETLRVVHLKTGRVSSVRIPRGQSLPLGESCLLSVPCTFWVADVQVSISHSK